MTWQERKNHNWVASISLKFGRICLNDDVYAGELYIGLSAKDMQVSDTLRALSVSVTVDSASKLLLSAHKSCS